jgi:hypothetical protein
MDAFALVDREAEIISSGELARLRDSGVCEEFPGEHDEDAYYAGQAYRMAMRDAQQALLNGLAVVLYHHFEQTMIAFLRQDLLPGEERDDQKLFSLREAIRRIAGLGIDCKRFASWQKLDELRLVANTAKHAEGPASKELQQLRPDLFPPPLLGEPGEMNPLYSSLAGQAFVLSAADLDAYLEAASFFWQNLAGEFNLLARSH